MYVRTYVRTYVRRLGEFSSCGLGYATNLNNVAALSAWFAYALFKAAARSPMILLRIPLFSLLTPNLPNKYVRTYVRTQFHFGVVGVSVVEGWARPGRFRTTTHVNGNKTLQATPWNSSARTRSHRCSTTLGILVVMLRRVSKLGACGKTFLRCDSVTLY